jgi:hypothetical protein
MIMIGLWESVGKGDPKVNARSIFTGSALSATCCM